MPSTMRFAVLGPVRAWRVDTELALGAPQQRAVLAMLLLAEGRQVAMEVLIDGLWADDPPPSAVGTVRTYISRLRRRLGPVQPIESAGAGYALPAGDGELDLKVFERLTKDARAARAGGHPGGVAQAAVLLRDALPLGQGACCESSSTNGDSQP